MARGELTARVNVGLGMGDEYGKARDDCTGYGSDQDRLKEWQ
jgi:hypothetical protein